MMTSLDTGPAVTALVRSFAALPFQWDGAGRTGFGPNARVVSRRLPIREGARWIMAGSACDRSIGGQTAFEEELLTECDLLGRLRVIRRLVSQPTQPLHRFSRTNARTSSSESFYVTFG